MDLTKSIGTSYQAKVKARRKTVRSQDMPWVMPFEENGTVADEHKELHAVKAKRMHKHPSAGLVAAYNVTHEPLRVWCRF